MFKPHVQFYKANLPLYCVFLVFLPIDNGLFFVSFNLFGFAIVYLFRLYFRKEEYFFYYNLAITKRQLFAFCAAVNLFASILILIVANAF